MKVNLLEGRNGSLIARIGGMVAFLEGAAKCSMQAGDNVDVMISGTNPRQTVLFIKPIEANHELVEHEGFEMSGHMCSTMAWIPTLGVCMTPGKVPVTYVNNVNVRYKEAPAPLVKGVCYIDKDYRSKGRFYRCEGVDSLDQLSLRS